MSVIEGAVSCVWTEAGPIMLDATHHLELPTVPAVPGIYRVNLIDRPGQTLPEIYIGEGGSLRKRLGNYRRPSTRYTAGHNHQRWVAHLASGGAMNLEIVTAANITTDGRRHQLPLERTSARVLVETTALALAYLTGDVHVLNRDAGA